MKPLVIPSCPDDLGACLEFIAPREHRAITLASNLVRDGRPRFPEPPAEGPVLVLEGDVTDPLGAASIGGLLLVTRTGILLHCLSESLDRAGAEKAIGKYLRKKHIRCILGQGGDNLFLESLLGVRPVRTVDYRLMVMPGPTGDDHPTIPLPSCGMAELRRAELRRAGPGDAEALLPLQEGYEKEEVIPPGDPFNRDACLANLSRNLEQQVIYLVTEAGKPVAKAGTNARGLFWDQLGGVYTLPEWRGRGLATFLTARIARERMCEGRKVALFVKVDNIPALRAYSRAGFRSDCPFRISYY